MCQSLSNRSRQLGFHCWIAQKKDLTIFRCSRKVRFTIGSCIHHKIVVRVQVLVFWVNFLCQAQMSGRFGRVGPGFKFLTHIRLCCCAVYLVIAGGNTLMSSYSKSTQSLGSRRLLWTLHTSVKYDIATLCRVL